MFTTLIRFILGCSLTLCLTLPAAAFAQTGPEASLNTNPNTSAHPIDPPTSYQMTLPGAEALGDDVFLQSTQDRTRALVISQALTGAAVGAVLGLGGYIISGFDWTPWSIPIFAAGGAAAGGLVGWALSQMTEAPRVASSVEWMQRDTPKAMEIRLFRLSYD